MKDDTRRKNLKKRKDFARKKLFGSKCNACGLSLTVQEKKRKKRLGGAIVCRVCWERARKHFERTAGE